MGVALHSIMHQNHCHPFETSYMYYKHTDTQTDRQTDRQTNRERERQPF